MDKTMKQICKCGARSFLVLAAAVAALACNDDERATGFEISVTDATMTSAKISVRELSDAVTYYVAVDNKPEIDAKCPTEEAYFAMKLDFIRVMAGVNGMSITGYLERELKRGRCTFTESDLYYDTDYYVCAFGLTPDGEVTTPLARKEFRTATFAPSETCRFIVQKVEPAATSLRILVGVSDPSVRYYVSAMTAAEFDGCASVNEAVADIIFSATLFDDEFFAAPDNTFAGRQELTLGDLEPATEYVVVVFGVNAAGEQTTEGETAKFSTLPA